MERRIKDEKELLEKIIAIESAIKPFLTAEALERLNNLKIAHQDKWLKVVISLYQLIVSGQITTKIDEETIKKILLKMSEKDKRKTKIRFVRK